MTPPALRTLVAKAVRGVTSSGIDTLTLLTGGGWASVYRARLDNGTILAAKVCHTGHEHLSRAEAAMLNYLKDKTAVPFPRVIGASEGILLLDFIENDGVKGNEGEREAGRLLAMLHANTTNQFGFEADTVFGPTPQPNPQGGDWVSFFRDHRLLYMTGIAHKAGKIDDDMRRRLEALGGKLDTLLIPPEKPALLHGDFWRGNVLFHQGRCAAFIDPAIYFGAPEADLAFATLFSSFGRPFFDGYREACEIAEGFFKERLGIYNLWPLLFHAYWFGGHYAGSVDATLRRLGF